MPYEFFLVGGAKMSSSKGVGASARDMADLLPPEVLRFLMIRTKPNSPVNFDVQEEGIVKLFNEFDRYHARAHAREERDARRAVRLSARASSRPRAITTARTSSSSPRSCRCRTSMR